MSRRTPRSGSRRPSGTCPGDCPSDTAAARTSFSVIRPPGPVPATFASSTPSSFAILLTRGVAWTRPGSWTRDTAGSGAGALAPSAPITTRTVPTGTTWPSSTRIRATLPAAGDGISTVVLSVWISTSGSSSTISCPSDTSQRAISPSVGPSPRSGSLNSYATAAESTGAARPRRRAARSAPSGRRRLARARRPARPRAARAQPHAGRTRPAGCAPRSRSRPRSGRARSQAPGRARARCPGRTTDPTEPRAGRRRPRPVLRERAGPPSAHARPAPRRVDGSPAPPAPGSAAAAPGSRHLVASRVESAESSTGRRRALELPAHEREHDAVVSHRSPVRRVQDPAQRPLLHEAKLARDRQRGSVLGVDANLDPVDPAELEADARQRGHGLRAEPLAGTALPDPVADLERALAAPRVQAGAADRLRLGGRKDPVDEVLPEVEPAAKLPQQLDLLFQRLRLLMCPGQPRPEVLERRVDRLLERGRVARLPAANDEPLRLDPVGRGPGQNSSSFRTASTTRSTDGM